MRRQFLCAAGFGLGWSADEMEATGADMKQRGATADEFLQVLKAIWTQNPVEFQGKFYKLPKSYIDLKPVQKPHPKIYLAAFAPAALQRLAGAALLKHDFATAWQTYRALVSDASEKRR